MRRSGSAGVWLVAVLTLFGSTLPAQSPPPPCVETLGLLGQKVQSDYAGFLLEVQGPRRVAHDSMMTVLRERANGADPEACLSILQAYIAWFDDPHLFLYQTARLDTLEARRRMAAVERVTLDTIALHARLRRNERGRDPLEGIWTDGRLRLAVVPDGDRRAGRFLGVVLTPDTTVWPLFAVRARFARLAPGRYQVDLSLPNYARRRIEGTLHRDDLLRLSPVMWGREAPVARLTPGQLDPRDPHRPTLRVVDGTVIVAMPSHDPTYRRALDSLIAANREVLRSASRLIIDLRGNEGGSAGTSSALMPYVVTDGQPAPPLLVQADARMLSSPDQIAYTRRAFGPETSAFVQGILARMEAAPGRLVPMFDPAQTPSEDSLPRAVMGPARVGILVDRGTVSAAEVLVLFGKQSPRVRVYGEPTAGALDYQSTSIVPLGPDERRWLLGYPTITRNERLPAAGMRGHGIAPDVPMDLSKIADPVVWVDRDLRRH